MNNPITPITNITGNSILTAPIMSDITAITTVSTSIKLIIVNMVVTSLNLFLLYKEILMRIVKGAV